jgi:hypothetical protein
VADASIAHEINGQLCNLLLNRSRYQHRCTRTIERLLIKRSNVMTQQSQPNQPQQGNKPGQPNQMPNKPGQSSQQSGSEQHEQSNKK